MHIVIITSSAKALFGLRKELVRSWVDEGHKVTAIGDLPENEFSQKCREAGFNYRYAPISRNGVNPLNDIKTLNVLTKLLIELKPDRVFCTFAKAVSYGAWASKKAGISETYCLISGLGSGFHGKSLKERMVGVVLKKLYKNAFSCSKKVIFQNNDNANDLVKLGLLDKAKIEIVNGSGVDLNRFQFKPLPLKQTILFVGRLLHEKGINELIEAAKVVNKKHPQASFMIVGDIDSNPSSLSQTEVDQLSSLSYLKFLGYQDDVRPFIEQSDIFLLPSYHEGTPRSVLEAMAMGRPIITTNAPGCRETVQENKNGFLVPVKDSKTLAERIIHLIENPETAAKMGHESRKIAEDKYDVNKIIADYKRILSL